ncbi:unnamed protein product [Prunus armeniaca]
MASFSVLWLLLQSMLSQLLLQWDMQALSISGGEQCIGFAINGSEFEKPENNPAITCSFPVESFGSNNFSGTLPPELVTSCGLGGKIPSTFAKLINMNILNASDNPFSGKIPSFIGNWRKLTSLVLRNTLISGSIPIDLGEYECLQILDLGFNNLTGELPSSLFNMSSLTYLFLGNNSLSGPLPSQKSNQLQSIDLSYNYFSGSIPPWVTTISQLTQKWAVSNAGFSDNSNQSFVETTLTQVSSADLTPDLFETSRVSPGSLRYHDLGLQNGPYTVTLQLQKRFLLGAIHKCHKVYEGVYLRSIFKGTSEGRTSTYRRRQVGLTEQFRDPSRSYTNYSRKEEQDGLIVGIAVLVGVVILLLLFAILYMRRRTSEKDDDEGKRTMSILLRGTLSDGRVVAVKQLSHQGKSQFVTEIATISAVQHRNLVKLYGCCIEGSHHILVYEYLENKSLDQALFGRNDLHLNWPTRFNILLGTARGLAYLHEESTPRIIHRDVKASNILLDAELSLRISDFGWAKVCDDEKTHMSTQVAGTIGYLTPEYAMRGHLTEKADVFGFGVVALEILSGRPNSNKNLDPEKIYLLEWYQPLPPLTFCHGK